MRLLKFVFLIIAFISVDLYSKHYFNKTLEVGEPVSVYLDLLSWELLYNPGASFGLLSGFTEILIFIQTLVISLVVYLYIRTKSRSKIQIIGFALIISGGLGNLHNRVLYGYVIDFISLKWWPAIFNVADIELRLGSVMILIYYLFLEKKASTTTKS